MSLHYHKCRCGNLWRHSGAMFDNEKAHTCSECGREQFYKYKPTKVEVKEFLKKKGLKR